MENGKDNQKKTSRKPTVKISEKKYITLAEASSYFNIGINRMKTMADNSNAVLYLNKKRLINREKFEAELEAMENEQQRLKGQK